MPPFSDKYVIAKLDWEKIYKLLDEGNLHGLTLVDDNKMVQNITDVHEISRKDGRIFRYRGIFKHEVVFFDIRICVENPDEYLSIDININPKILSDKLEKISFNMTHSIDITLNDEIKTGFVNEHYYIQY